METVKQNGCVLQHASVELQGDREIVVAAVKQDWLALEHASAALKSDADVVMYAMSRDANALRFSSSAIRCGGLKEHLRGLLSGGFNVPKHTFLATVLFGAKGQQQQQQQPGGGGGGGRSAPCCDNSGCVLSLLRPSPLLPGPLSTLVKRLIWSYAGVMSGPRWRAATAAAKYVDSEADEQPLDSLFGEEDGEGEGGGEGDY